MNMENAFFSGQFYACYEIAKGQQDNEQAQHFMQLFERFGYDTLPAIVAHKTQCVEYADETYDLDDEVKRIRLIQDEEQFKQAVKQLEITAQEGTEDQKALSFYTQGRLFLFAHHYAEAIHCFTQAVKCAPQVAVFSGIAGQTMQRLNYSPFEVMLHIDRAIQADQTNPRWYWNRALVLMQLYKDLEDERFLENAIVTLEQAQSYCRDEQKSLATAIANTFDTIRDILMR